MGFDVHVGTVETKLESISTPNGWLFGCSSFDNLNWHWCDNQDGDWLNEALDSQGSKTRVTQVKCRLKNNQVPACLSGKYFSYRVKDFFIINIFYVNAPLYVHEGKCVKTLLYCR